MSNIKPRIKDELNLLAFFVNTNVFLWKGKPIVGIRISTEFLLLASIGTYIYFTADVLWRLGP